MEKIVGERLQETKPSIPTNTPYRISQCYFLMATPVNSVVITVCRRGEGPEARDPKDFWKETFHRDADEADKDKDNAKNKEKDKDKEKEREKHEKPKAAGREEEEEKKSKPLKVEGVGEEAFWTGNAIGGALFVLKDHAYVRISAGGAGDQDAKIARCKAVAQVALTNLK